MDLGGRSAGARLRGEAAHVFAGMVFLIALWTGSSSFAEKAPIEGWRTDFDDGTLGDAVGPTYVIRSTGANDNSRISWRISEGVLTLGARFDKESAQGAGDYVALEWRNPGRVSLVSFPVLEIRYRVARGHLVVLPVYEFADGSTRQPYFYLPESVGGDLAVSAYRLAADSSLPTKWTPRRLAALTIWLVSDQPCEAQIDWVRLRGLNAQEATREDDWIALMEDYTPAEPEVLKDFFPFGVWSDSASGSSMHKMGPWLGMAMLARAGLNFVTAAKADEAHVAAAEAFGMKLMFHTLGGYAQFDESREAARDWARQYVNLAGRSPAVLGYQIADEPGMSLIWTLAGLKRTLEELEGDRVPVVNFWDAFAVKVFSPYLTLLLTDHYPLAGAEGEGPVGLYQWCRQIAIDNDNKRQWVVLQSFGSAPWRSRPGYRVPSPEELRLMTFAALAGGARGLIFYCYNYDRYRMLADQWGNPNELHAEVRRLISRLVGVSQCLLDSTVELHAEVPSDNERVIAGVLVDPARSARYIVAVNTSVTAPEGARLSLPRGWPALGRGVYDLFALSQVPVEEGFFEVGPLDPGDGRVYLVGKPDLFERDCAAIRKKNVEEALRSQAVDLHLARRHGADLVEVDRLRAEALELARAGGFPASLEVAESAGKTLTETLAAIPSLFPVEKALAEVAELMGTVEPAMYEDNPKIGDKTADLIEPYWAIHARWAAAWEKLFSGPTDSLSAEAEKLRSDAKDIVARVRERLAGAPLF
ncbi:MAG: hypothetical protein V2A58_12795 [Planctomycetota bacterium]